MKEKQKLIIGTFIAIIVFIGVFFAYNNLSDNYTPEEETIENTSNQERKTAPDFSVLNYNDEKVKLSDFKGKPVVLNFWATWCGPCKSELPAFDKLYHENKENVEFVMVNLTDGYNETIDGVKEFIEKNNYSFPVYFDTTSGASNVYSVRSIPLTVFIDEEGKIVRKQVGAMNEKTLRKYVNDLIGG